MILCHSKFNEAVALTETHEPLAMIKKGHKLVEPDTVAVPTLAFGKERTRASIFRLLHTLACLDAGVLDSNATEHKLTVFKVAYIPLFLHHFSGTTAQSDRTILELFWLVERCTGISVHHHILREGWGPQRKRSGLEVADNVEFLETIHAKHMMDSIHNLYVNDVKLEPSLDGIKMRTFDNVATDVRQDVFYHTPFYLTLLMHYLEQLPDRDTLLQTQEWLANPSDDEAFAVPVVADAKHRIFDLGIVFESNMLGLTIACLSCQDQNLRQTAFTILDKIWSVFHAADIPSMLEDVQQQQHPQQQQSQDGQQSRDSQRYEAMRMDVNFSQRKQARREYMRKLWEQQRKQGDLTVARRIIATVKEKRQLYLLLNSLRNGVTERGWK